MSSVAESSLSEADYRLPTDVRPTHYDLTVRTDLVNSKFDGIVKINLDVEKETSTIVFNVNELKLTDAKLYSDALQVEQTTSSMSFDKTMEREILTFSTPLPASSKAQLRVAFEGELNGSLLGYYRSVGGEDGKSIYSLTQFEPISARNAFPCWDEPLLKATFSVTMVSRADTVNLSNMPVLSETIYSPEPAEEHDWLTSKLASLTLGNDIPAEKWKITRFETTPPMSTYLVAWANGPFEYLESSYTSPLSGKTRPLRFYATSDVIHQAQFALDIKRLVLPLCEKVFEIEYPLPKLDTLVASDYDCHAMENWGLITGRTSTFLLDPTSENLQVKQKIAETMCHEVAHMWFGDITTMAWWDNLYLNEGFATLMANVIILDKVFPEWKLDATFITGSISLAMNLDAKPSSHPVEVECPDANMVNQIFDALSYQKAASILRMLSAYVGEERFLKGVSMYLKAHLFANSVTKDLWDGISAATGMDISKVMDNWIEKIGYPVVTVTETQDGIHLRQDRFLETGHAGENDNETIWNIPLSLLTVSDQGHAIVDRELVLDEREMTIKINISRTFKLNAGTVSFYRVLYSTERLVAIGAEAAKMPSPFSLQDRIGLVYDAFALAEAGYSTVSSALSLVNVLRNEQEYVVLESMLSSLGLLRSVWWEYPDIVQSLSQFEQSLVMPIVQRLGYERVDNESVDVRALRTLAINHAAITGEESVVKELAGRFTYYMQTGDDTVIPADLIQAVYPIAVRHGNREEWEAVKQIITKHRNPASAVAAMNAIGFTQDLKLAEETFQYVLTDARDQDLLHYFDGLSDNPATRKFLAKAFKQHYNELSKRLEGNFSMRFLVHYAFYQLSSDQDYEDTVQFFKDRDTSKYDLALKQSLDNIASRAAWIKRSTTDIQQWAERQRSTSRP